MPVVWPFHGQKRAGTGLVKDGRGGPFPFAPPARPLADARLPERREAFDGVAPDARDPVRLAAGAGVAVPGPAILPSVDAVPGAIVAALTTYLQPQTGQPDPLVAVLRVSHRELGVGNLRGLDRAGTFDAVELRGGQVDAVVRVVLFGADRAAAGAAITELQGRLLAARDELWDAGFLELAGVDGSMPTLDGGSWSRSADFKVLFEYHLAPGSDTGLITRIPIDVGQGVPGLPLEATVVTDDLVRWDQSLVPTLVLRGSRTVTHLSAASYIPGASPTAPVTLRRTVDGATGAPTSFPDLATFLAALADLAAPAVHAEVQFPDLDAFLAGFVAVGDLPLGDLDGDGNPDDFTVAELAFQPTISLPAVRDRFEVSVGDAPLDQVAIVHLRATGSFA